MHTDVSRNSHGVKRSGAFILTGVRIAYLLKEGRHIRFYTVMNLEFPKCAPQA